jgi:acyl carrier protein
MVPSVVMGVDTWPRTSSGKIDRNRLPKAIASCEGDVGVIVAPRTPDEVITREVFGSVLGRDVDVISMESNFFELGGNSLRAVALARRLSDALERQVSVADVLDRQTIGLLTRLVSSAGSSLPSLTISQVPTGTDASSFVHVVDSLSDVLIRADLSHRQNQFFLQGYRCQTEPKPCPFFTLPDPNSLRLRYEDLSALVSFDSSELREILIDDVGLPPEEAQSFLVAVFGCTGGWDGRFDPSAAAGVKELVHFGEHAYEDILDADGHADHA